MRVINWKKVWKRFDNWAYNGSGLYTCSGIDDRARRIISRAVNEQIKTFLEELEQEVPRDDNFRYH